MLDRRNYFSRTYLLRDNSRRLENFIRPIHYPEGGSLEDMQPIDIDVRVARNNRFVLSKATYEFYQHEKGIGFNFVSKRNGYSSLKLLNPFPVNRVVSEPISDECTLVKFIGDLNEVHFMLLPHKIRTWKVIKNEFAQKTFIWEYKEIAKGRPSIKHIVAGRDRQSDLYHKSQRQRCEIHTNQVDLQNGHIFTEEFTGLAYEKDPIKRKESGRLVAAEYPVKMAGEDITEDPTVNADDGHGDETGDPNEWDVNGGWPYDFFIMGLVDDFHPGFRFQTVNYPAGATTDDANIRLDVTEYRSANGSGTLNGNDVDDAIAFSDSERPATMTLTTAGETVSVTAAGIINVDVTDEVAEIIARGGWAANNDMKFGITSTSFSPSYEYCEMGDSNGATNPPRLTINYTEAGGAQPQIIRNRRWFISDWYRKAA